MNGTARVLLAGGGVILAVWAVQRFVPGGPSAGPRTQSDIPATGAVPVSDKAERYSRAKEFVAPGEFFNAEPFTIASLIGKKVILVDFWTYSCINCQRTQPYLNAWYEAYRDAGLEIIGVHTPEFEFEKVPGNVRTAITNAGIKYPVVQDNEFGTWRAYGNQYWPRKYLIDADGYIIYDHIGEGAYEETEQRIREALAELAARGGASMMPMADEVHPSVSPVERGRVGTPETYFGAFRNASYLPNVKTGSVGTQTVQMPSASLQRDHLTYLAGTWDFTDEYAQCIRDCIVRLTYEARQVNLVAESSGAVSLTVTLDSVEKGEVSVSASALYRLIDDVTSGTHTIELGVPGGVRLYTFTFG